MKWCIKQRSNPQHGTYYVAEGKLSNRDATRRIKSIYGSSERMVFDTEEEYEAAIYKLKADGHSVY